MLKTSPRGPGQRDVYTCLYYVISTVWMVFQTQEANCLGH